LGYRKGFAYYLEIYKTTGRSRIQAGGNQIYAGGEFAGNITLVL
jgi:hypothetical protein